MTGTFRLIPTRRSPSGCWFRAWTVDGTDDEAVTAAKEFFAAEGVPVLVRGLSEQGVLSRSLGIWGERRLRVGRRR